MNYAEIRSRIRAIIFSITGIIAAFLFLRITLDLISADADNSLVSLINTITNPLITPFEGLVTLPQTGILEVLNEAAIISFIVYILSAIAISEIITSFIYEHFKDIFQNIIDAMFKLIEALLILRIVFDLFGISLTLNSPEFVQIIHTLTAWSQGIIFDQPFLTGKINLSAIIALFIVVVIDLLTERFLDSLYSKVSTVITNSKIALPSINIKNVISKLPTKPKPIVEVEASKTQPIQQNITINIPIPSNSAIPIAAPQVIVDNKNDPQSLAIQEIRGPGYTKEG